MLTVRAMLVTAALAVMATVLDRHGVEFVSGDGAAAFAALLALVVAA